MRGTQTARAGETGGNRAVVALFVAAMLAPLPWVVAHFLPPHNHDAAALLQFAERWLAGERLYVDLVDVNPPLIIVMSLLPALLGRLLSMPATTVLVLCTLAYVAVCTVCALRATGPLRRIAEEPYRLLLAPLLLYLTIVHPGFEFSQRENLMVASTIPYLLLARARLLGPIPSPFLSVVIALLAGIGFAIKPHFVIVPVLVEAWLLWRRGWRTSLADLVPWTIAALFVAYAAGVVILLPEYLGSVVPLVRAQYLDLGVGSAGHFKVLFASGLTPTLLLFVPLAAITGLLSREPLARLFALAAFGAIVFAVVQAKGWSYQVMPAECFVIGLGGVLVCEAIERLSDGAGVATRRLIMLAAIGGFLMGCYYLAGMSRTVFARKLGFEQSQAGQLMRRFETHAPGQPVLVLTPGLYPQFPALNYTGSIQAMRFMNLWLLQSVYTRCLPDGQRYRDPARMPEAERVVFQAIADDLLRYRPPLVVIDKSPGIPWCGSEFDILEYFLRNPAFAGEWAQYRFLEEFDRYRIFIRR